MYSLFPCGTQNEKEQTNPKYSSRTTIAIKLQSVIFLSMRQALNLNKLCNRKQTKLHFVGGHSFGFAKHIEAPNRGGEIHTCDLSNFIVKIHINTCS